MSDIRFHKLGVEGASYAKILQSKISDVCKKIDFLDTSVTWIIFSPNSLSPYFWGSNTLIEKLLIGQNGKDYGFCFPEKNEVWISTVAITASEVSTLLEQGPLNRKSVPKNCLTDVILDEITHLQTHCNHGNNIYDSQLKSNTEKYYSNR